MNRRQFLVLAQAIGLATWYGDMAYAQTGTIRTRKSATTSAAVIDIETLRKGISSLTKNTTATDYASWMYWANSHGTPDAVPPMVANVWNQCHHGTSHFLTWHRAYLFFFESLIRDITQQGDFALPYWDWYGANTIPQVFTNDETANSLSHNRAYRARTLIREPLQSTTFEQFQASFEGNPHGTVHVMVGGEMGSPDTAARDPIFWAHHANVDRMWEVWLALDSSRKNPSDSSWLNKKFAFDIEAKKVLSVSEMLATDHLGYRYDSVAIIGPTDSLPPRPPNTIVVKTNQNVGPLGVAPQSIATKKKLSLTGESVNIQLEVPAASKGKVSTMAVPAQAKAANLTVKLEGVKATELGIKRGFEYRIYANLPMKAGVKNNHSNYYLGVINSFQLGHHAQHGVSLTFSISSLATAQAKEAAWSSSDVNFSLISDDSDEKQPLVEIENIQLILSADPIM